MYYRLWLDTIGLGIVLALVRWASTVSATDKITTRVLVVSLHSAQPAAFAAATFADKRPSNLSSRWQYHLLFISLTTSGYLIAMTLHQFAAGFGEYRRFLDTRCEWPRQTAWRMEPAAQSAVPRGLDC